MVTVLINALRIAVNYQGNVQMIAHQSRLPKMTVVDCFENKKKVYDERT